MPGKINPARSHTESPEKEPQGTKRKPVRRTRRVSQDQAHREALEQRGQMRLDMDDVPAE